MPETPRSKTVSRTKPKNSRRFRRPRLLKAPPESPLRAGIWLSSREAIIVKVQGRGRGAVRPQVVRLQSEVEGWHKTTGGRHGRMPYQQASAMAPVENRLKERRERDLRAFFREVLSEVEDVEEIVVFGPGIVKSKLEHWMHRLPRWRDRWVHVESADQMTERQVVARTLRELGGEAARRLPGQTWRGRVSRRQVHDREGGRGELSKKRRSLA